MNTSAHRSSRSALVPGMLAVFAASALSAAVLAADGDLVGDGVHDDTAAIQRRLDSGAACVYLPPPPKEYLISSTLRIGSGQ